MIMRIRGQKTPVILLQISHGSIKHGVGTNGGTKLRLQTMSTYLRGLLFFFIYRSNKSDLLFLGDFFYLEFSSESENRIKIMVVNAHFSTVLT